MINEGIYCTRCNADLSFQKGFNPMRPYWVCKGCGEMLINFDSEDESGIVWRCDACKTYLNNQDGFANANGTWICLKCGYLNKLNRIYESEAEYIADLMNPLRGLSEDEALELSIYDTVETINDHTEIVKALDCGSIYVKKILSQYDIKVFRYLQEHPICNMPRIVKLYEGISLLTVIEEYIDGLTVEALIEQGAIDERIAIMIAIEICKITRQLHCSDIAIIHRDIKPENIMVTMSGEVFLLDINAAKVYKSEEIEDTILLGTRDYAAPEQYGFGDRASSERTDVYQIGMLLNKMLTGKFPKEKKANGPVWDIIERCIKIVPDERYSDIELLSELQQIRGKYE